MSDTDPTIVFETILFFSGIYKRANTIPESNRPGHHFVTFSAEDLPDALVKYADRMRVSEQYPELGPIVTVHQPHPPMVVSKPGSRMSLDTTINCAVAANIGPDSLLVNHPVRLAVSGVEFDTDSSAHGRRHVNALRLLAIEVDVDKMVERYDELCAQYFTGD